MHKFSSLENCESAGLKSPLVHTRHLEQSGWKWGTKRGVLIISVDSFGFSGHSKIKSFEAGSTMPLKPFFVIRNSIHDCSLNGNADTVEQSENTDGDNDSYEKQDHVSVVRLVEPSAKGLLMLDFDQSNEAQIEEFVESTDDSRLTYIDENNWQHLHAFATLIGRLELLNQFSIEETHGLLAGQTAPCFVLLKKEVVDVLSDELSIERLFSWHVLKDARDRGDVQWKDIRKFLSTVRNEVPYFTKDGIHRLPYRRSCQHKSVEQQRAPRRRGRREQPWRSKLQRARTDTELALAQRKSQAAA